MRYPVLGPDYFCRHDHHHHFMQTETMLAFGIRDPMTFLVGSDKCLNCDDGQPGWGSGVGGEGAQM